MASKKLAERKKQRRAVEKRRKALRCREAAVQEKRQKSIEHRVNEMMKHRPDPHRNPVDGSEVTFSKRLSREETIARLNHNLEILRALEEDYDKEMAARQERNSGLEEIGCSSLQEKMDALHKQAVDHQKEEGLEFGGEAEVVFTPFDEEKGTVG